MFANPEELAYGRADATTKVLYRVRFRQCDVWPDYHVFGTSETIAIFYFNMHVIQMYRYSLSTDR